jgi:hypothetical protein
MIDGRRLVELSYDIQSGLGNTDVPDFEELRVIGMSATLAMHLRGLAEIEYEILRKVSDHFFSIPSSSLKEALNVLAEVEYVHLLTKGTKIITVTPQVPRFQDLYQGVGNYFTFSELNEHEQGTILILSELQNKPENRDRLISSLGVDNSLFSRCMQIGEYGNYFKEFRTRGRNIITSPFYFADNLEGLADVSAKAGSSDIAAVLDIIKNNQGWPLSMILKNAELGGTMLTPNQKSLLIHLCTEGILKPPSINFQNTSESFVFTPRPGGGRMDTANREIYERAMALVSCVRKGQLLADQYRIRMPIRILEALRDRGYIGSNSEAASQYKNLVFLKVGMLVQIPGGRHQFKLNKTEENIDALNLAISLLRTGELANLEVNQEARLALSNDEKYIQSIISSAELKRREQVALDGEAKSEFEQLMLSYE